MASSAPSRVKKSELWPPLESLVLAILAGLVVLSLRWDMHKSALLIIFETAFYFSLPVVLMIWIQRRFGSDRKIFEQGRLVFTIQAGAVLFALLPVLFQVVTRTFSYGDPFEVNGTNCFDECDMVFGCVFQRTKIWTWRVCDWKLPRFVCLFHDSKRSGFRLCISLFGHLTFGGCWVTIGSDLKQKRLMANRNHFQFAV